MLSHLPILQVIVPLLAAPACLLLDRARAAWLFACMASLVSVVISGLLVFQVHQFGVLSYRVGCTLGYRVPY